MRTAKLLSRVLSTRGRREAMAGGRSSNVIRAGLSASAATVAHKRYWGTGIAQQAAEACINYAFRHLGFGRIIANTRPANLRARGLLKKISADFTGYVDFRGVKSAAYEITRVIS